MGPDSFSPAPTDRRVRPASLNPPSATEPLYRDRHTIIGNHPRMALMNSRSLSRKAFSIAGISSLTGS